MVIKISWEPRESFLSKKTETNKSPDIPLVGILGEPVCGDLGPQSLPFVNISTAMCHDCPEAHTTEHPHTSGHHWEHGLLWKLCSCLSLQRDAHTCIAVCTTVSLKKGRGNRAGFARRAFLTQKRKGCQSPLVTFPVAIQSHFWRRFWNKSAH